MQFEFSTATKILFGPGRLNSIGKIANEFGKKALIVSGCPKAISGRLVNLLEAHEITCSYVKIDHEPTIDRIRELVDFAQKTSPDMLIAIGGGSALDSAKATAVLLSNPGDITDYLEVIGLNKPLVNPSIPLISIPTTSGTGSEVTRNAVLGSPTHQSKVSLRSPYLLPKLALVDPELILSVPPLITAYTGLDTLTQLIEPYTSNLSNPLTDSLCIEGIQRVSKSLFQAYDHGNDIQAREDMSLASLFSGLALANSRLGAVHGMAGPIGGEISAPHGAICACLLPLVMDANISALVKISPDHPVKKRYDTISKILCGNPKATTDNGIQWVRNFCLHANIRPLSEYGLSEALFNKIIEKGVIASSMRGNAVTLSEVELRTILKRSL